MVLDLEENLVFYGAYHRNPVNIGIHIICVPLIFLTALGLISPYLQMSVPLVPSSIPVNASTIVACLYAFFYFLMEPVAGSVLGGILLSCTYFVNKLMVSYPSHAFQYAWIVHLACWIFQFIGHGSFEKRAPALLDNLIQALFLAPFFVWFEVLFMIGYRPDLEKRVNAAVKKEIAKFRR